MELLTDKTIGEKLNVGSSLGTQLQTAPNMVDRIDKIVENVKSVIELVTSKKNSAQNLQPVQQLPYQKMDNPDLISQAVVTNKNPPRIFINEGALKDELNQKLTMVNFLPEKFKKMSLIKLAEEFKKDKSSEEMVINFIKGMISKVVTLQ